jgi:hypothetical protein
MTIIITAFETNTPTWPPISPAAKRGRPTVGRSPRNGRLTPPSRRPAEAHRLRNQNSHPFFYK